MDTPFDNTINRLRALKIDRLVLDACRLVEADIFDLIRQDQLYLRGIDADGLKLKKYSDKYRDYKAQLGLRYQVTTLRLSGDYVASFFIDFTNIGFTVEAHDWKADILDDRYPNHRNLTKESKEKLSEIIRPLVQELVKQKLAA